MIVKDVNNFLLDAALLYAWLNNFAFVSVKYKTPKIPPYFFYALIDCSWTSLETESLSTQNSTPNKE